MPIVIVEGLTRVHPPFRDVWTVCDRQATPEAVIAEVIAYVAHRIPEPIEGRPRLHPRFGFRVEVS